MTVQTMGASSGTFVVHTGPSMARAAGLARTGEAMVTEEGLLSLSCFPLSLESGFPRCLHVFLKNLPNWRFFPVYCWLSVSLFLLFYLYMFSCDS